ncbi:MAG: glycosyltransferase family 4 protein [Caldilineaceae bacterium]
MNLQSNVGKDRSVNAVWGLIEQDRQGMLANLPFYNRYWTFQAGLRTRRTIAQMQRQGQMDALFFHTQVMAVLATNWVKRIPSIISLDATPLQYDELGKFYDHERGPKWAEEIKWRLNRNCFYHAHHLVTWSAWAKQGLVDAYEVPADKITIIPPGINIHEWATSQPRRTGTGPVKILFVGGNLKRKGGADLIAAFRTLRAELTNRSGAAGEEPPLEIELHMVTHSALVAEPGVFHYEDMEPNSPALRHLFHECDIFCLPTYGDCLPISLVEASAAGLPCITTHVGGTAEIIEDQKNGFLLQPGDQEALTTHLRCLITNQQLRLQQGREAYARVCRRFDAEQNTVQVLELLKRAHEASGNKKKRE